MAIDKITTPAVTDDSVTLAKMAPGTDGNIISYDASGNPVAVATGNDGQVLTSTGAGSPPAFETPASAANTPNFFASLTSDQVVSNNTATKVAYSNEVYDTNTVYNNSTYRFTPGFAGKSFIGAMFWSYDQSEDIYWQAIELYKNGSSLVYNNNANLSTNDNQSLGSAINLVVAHDSDDYYEIYVKVKTSNSGDVKVPTGSGNNATFRNWFYGYKIIE